MSQNIQIKEVMLNLVYLQGKQISIMHFKRIDGNKIEKVPPILSKVILDQRLLPPQVEDIELPPFGVKQNATWPLHRGAQHQVGEKTEGGRLQTESLRFSIL